MDIPVNSELLAGSTECNGSAVFADYFCIKHGNKKILCFIYSCLILSTYNFMSVPLFLVFSLKIIGRAFADPATIYG